MRTGTTPRLTLQDLESWTPTESEDKIPDYVCDEIREQIIQKETEFQQHCTQQLNFDYWEEILSDAKPNVTYSDDETIRNISLNQCLHHCLTEPADRKAFLYTYSTYVSSEVLLKKLFQIYNTPSQVTNPREVKIMCINFIKVWLTECFEDWTKPMLISFFDFIESIKSEMSNAVVLLRIVERKIHPTETLFPDFPTNTKVVHLLDINTKVLAQQLTIQAQTIYTACKHQEFLNLNWTRPHRRHKAPNICRILERFQEVYHWVASMIMEQDDLDEQVATATKFIDLANELRNLNNFETLVHVVAGLRCASVYRMRRLWNLIDKDKVELLNNLESVTSSDKAFLELRNAMNTCCAPLIPYLGVYLNNLTFIEDIIVHPPPNTFNFRKMKMIYGVVATLLLYKPKYQIVPDVGIQEAIEYSMRNLAFQSEDEYYKQSLKLEPRQTHP